MADEKFFSTIKTHSYPVDFIPAESKLIISVDHGSPGGDCTVKGYYENGIYYIQEVMQNSIAQVKKIS
jgi:hypothetical protein